MINDNLTNLMVDYYRWPVLDQIQFVLTISHLNALGIKLNYKLGRSNKNIGPFGIDNWFGRSCW